MGKNKEAYRKLCHSEADIPVFMQPWWLDVVCEGDNWDVCLAFDKTGHITGALPFFRTRFRGFRVIRMPLLTPFLGPWLSYPPKLEKNSRRYAFEHRVLNDLIHQLPRVAYFTQNFHYDFSNWLPFYWKGYRQTTYYSYYIEGLKDLKIVFSRFQENVKRNIKKAEKQVDISIEEDVNLFYKMNEMTFARKGLKMPYSIDFFRKIDEALKHRKKRKIFFAIDKNNGIPHAAIYLIYDSNAAYFLAGGLDPKFKTSGAMTLLFWEAIKDAADRVNRFDFEGSIIPGVENFFRSFGSVQQPYFQIYKGKNKFFDFLKVLFEKRL